MNKLKLAFAAGGLSLFAGAASAVTVQNASFETQGSGGAADAAGWTQVNTDGRLDPPGSFQSPDASDGTFVMRLNSGPDVAPTPRVSQLISGFTVGNSYRLSVDVGDYSPVHGSDSAGNFAMDAIGGATTTALFSKTGLGIAATLNQPSTFAMALATLTFIADQTDMTIMFRGQVVDDSSFVIDNVRLEDLGVIPTPLAAPLLITAFAIAGFVRRRSTGAR